MSETLVHFQSMPPMAAELTVEQEILLPDYLPGVFKILSAWLEPDLHWNRISENRIQLEGSAKLLVLYAADQDDQIHLAEHSAELSKTMELPAKEEEGEMQLSWQIQSCRLTAIPSDRRRIGCGGRWWCGFAKAAPAHCRCRNSLRDWSAAAHLWNFAADPSRAPAASQCGTPSI